MQNVQKQVTLFVDECVSRFGAGLATLLLVTLTCLPQLAFAQGVGTLCTNANTALNWIEIGVYFILIVAVLGSAVAAAFGRMEWATVGRILVGCIVAGVATAVVQALTGMNGC